MLYVFHVDAGTMITFDMSLAFENVSNLKQYIEKVCKIPSEKQVLLVSGGDCLDPDTRVNLYSAGTDTNPIYLFSKSVIESKSPPCSIIDLGLDADLIQKAGDLQNLPPKIDTVNQRTHLAQRFHESAKEQAKICDDLVHDQHLQQQGWAAVVANLEDITALFKKRTEVFEKTFLEFTNERETYLNFLQHFNEDLQTLAKIPVLPQLLEICEEENKSAEAEECTENSDEAGKEAKTTTLLEWISASDNKSSMDQFFEHCSKGLEQFSDELFKSLHEEVERAIESSEKPDMKEVKGLGDRLFGLDQLMCEAKRIVQAQADLAQSFLQNQARASVIGDSSILPDLCLSHQKQLQVMIQNHQKLFDIRKRCTKAKEELRLNLYHRLKWVTYVQSVMLETDQRLVVYHDNLKRLRESLEALQQIHLAPATYLAAVAEVVRRRAFSQAFLAWASELACHLLTIHNEEVARRKDFQSQFDGHFLNSLFPGMNDMPPPYATQAPSIFDSSLPKLNVEDIEELKRKLPDLGENLGVPDISAITNFFMIKSLVKAELDKADGRAIEEKLVQVVTEVGLASNLDQNLLKPADSETCLAPHAIPLLKDLDKFFNRGCESETDTEEFEKVGQSPLELHFDKDVPSGRARTQDVATLTEDNLETSRTEQDKLRSTLLKMSGLVSQTLAQLRSELTDLKNFFLLEKDHIEVQHNNMGALYKNFSEIKNIEVKEALGKLSTEYESELEEHKKTATLKTNEINDLQAQISHLESTLSEAQKKLSVTTKDLEEVKDEKSSELQDVMLQIEKLKVEKEQSIKEITDKLNRDHKDEIDNIRSRFKLMSIAKLDRSPTEPLESPDHDFKEPPSHEALILQIKQNYENDKAKAIKEAIELESKRWAKILDDKVKELSNKFENEKQKLVEEVAKKISEDKDKMIDVLREREANLNLECIKYKNTIQQLAENETERQNEELESKIEKLRNENDRLEMELCLERSKKTDEGIQDMGISVSVAEGKVDVATSPMAKKDKLSKSQMLTGKSGKLNVDSVSFGDTVAIVWDEEHENYVIVQDSESLYFLHSNCIEPLGLAKKGEKRIAYCFGIVTEKEHCKARKSSNRYKVPQDTTFYRLKVVPRSKSRERVAPMTQSQVVEQTVAAVEGQSSSKVCQSLPPTPVNVQTFSVEESIQCLKDAMEEPSSSSSSAVPQGNDDRIKDEKKDRDVKKEQTNVTRRKEMVFITPNKTSTIKVTFFLQRYRKFFDFSIFVPPVAKVLFF
ncbi:RB1-inducible coiled-coil protein 1 isoform X1 [Agrilus planipennis]|uniref:RB1-inducible coiled-coil protein 1 n=1 Tax=Agrilus planipennis TaxID=224129 RepID=A0A1W4XKW6_AGRPL|nr:RB1-inducible coiled-coil protein 1 isoform X1 [Agrilus planipennis]XP_018336630.1 RB1-inducible coiled-coil protein 1 isoform X1 [Agrilus planipennis]XP_018336631.1 RB1-inducible coiled-coil protein 1 isoform X1 [Agrilus planipennis]